MMIGSSVGLVGRQASRISLGNFSKTDSRGSIKFFNKWKRSATCMALGAS